MNSQSIDEYEKENAEIRRRILGFKQEGYRSEAMAAKVVGEIYRRKEMLKTGDVGREVGEGRGGVGLGKKLSLGEGEKVGEKTSTHFSGKSLSSHNLLSNPSLKPTKPSAITTISTHAPILEQ